jgi:CubicO group peptidase (beta-lactamase class C family)
MATSIPGIGGFGRSGGFGATMAGLALLLVPALHAAAQPPGRPATGAPTAFEAAAVEEIVDPFFADRMQKGRITGAVFVLVQDGEVRFSRGYGYADAETRRPVDPETTIFRAGSISKLVTATAVMQLYDRRTVALDRDVNAYLETFKLENTFTQPVTLANLLTHTAGFAEYIHGQHQLDAARVLPLAEYLKRRMPPRALPPGQLFSYNDHGMSLAGLIVQEVSGQPFADYVGEKILQALGMDRSTFNGRPDARFLPDLATGYRVRDGRNIPYELDYVQTVPAAGLYTTGSDLARFMIAHLQYGRLGDARILSESAAREMQARHFAHHPKLRGRAYGFSELFVNGQRILFHDGAMPGFTSRVCLLPEQGLGFFVSYTSDRLGLKSELTTTLMNHFFPPAGAPAPAAPTVAAGDLAAFAGTYDQIAGFSTNALRLGSMLENYAVVEPSGPDTLAVFGTRFTAVEPMLFRAEDGQHVAFGRDARGRVRYLFVGSGAYEKLGALDSPRALMAEAGALLLVALPMGVLWPLGMLVRPGRVRASWRRQFPAGRTVAGVESFLIVLFFVTYVALSMQIEHYWQIMRNEFPWPWVTRLLIVPLIVTALAPVVAWAAARAWVRPSGTLFGRIWMSLAAAATLLFVVLMWHWHLIGFNY